MIELHTDKTLPIESLLALYASVGWAAYTRDPAGLARAAANSTYVVSAWAGEELVGLARCLSDDVSIMYLQDILVHPAWQGQGVGRRLLTACLERFAHVRAKVLLTDDEARQRRFYESLGYCNTKDVKEFPLNAFVRFD